MTNVVSRVSGFQRSRRARQEGRRFRKVSRCYREATKITALVPSYVVKDKEVLAELHQQRTALAPVLGQSKHPNGGVKAVLAAVAGENGM
jgi:hypothetical protein